MRQLTVSVLAIAVVVFAVFSAALTSGVGAAGQLPWQSSLLTAGELRELGLTFDPITSSATPSLVTKEKAVRFAMERDGRSEDPVEVLHAMVRPDASTPARGAYVVIFGGGPKIPTGPNGALQMPRVSGVVIDDQTGEFLTGFYYGP